MKLSTRGRYGLKAVADLAAHGSEGHVALKTIAERQGLSENYLEQLFASLKKANIVKSARGSQGGYVLAVDPDSITVGDILRALEGSLAPTECVSGDFSANHCGNVDCCVTRNVWEKIRDGINNVVDSITLRELAEGFNKGSPGLKPRQEGKE